MIFRDRLMSARHRPRVLLTKPRVAFALFVVAAFSTTATAVQWQDLTADDAQAVVTAFEGGAPMEFGRVELWQAGQFDEPPDMYSGSEVYELETPDEALLYRVSRWWADRLTFYDRLYAAAWIGGERPEAWSDFYSHAYTQDDLLGLQMPMENAQQIATSYAQARYPDSSAFNDVQSWDCDRTAWGFVPSYGFRFFYRGATGTYGVNMCFVQVDSVMGKVVRYRQVYFPTEVSMMPAVTAEQAGQLALSALMAPGATVIAVDGPAVLAPDALGVERLAWEAKLEGYESATGEYRWGQYLADVDAHTGEVFYHCILMGERPYAHEPSFAQRNIQPSDEAPAGLRDRSKGSLSVQVNGRRVSLAYAPFVRGGVPYLFVRYLGAFGGRAFGYERGSVYVRTGGGLARVRVGNSAVVIGGHNRRYDAALVNLCGRVYLPLSMFRDLSGADITYDPAAKRIRIAGVRRAPYRVQAKARP
jgi:hypothetical protein